MDNLWVIIVLLVVGGAIVTIRLFRNGALEEADPAAFEAPAPARTPASATAPPDVASASAAATSPTRARTARRASSSKPASAPSRPAAWAGGDCPHCGSSTVPSAKFCGECGHRLIP